MSSREAAAHSWFQEKGVRTNPSAQAITTPPKFSRPEDAAAHGKLRCGDHASTSPHQQQLARSAIGWARASASRRKAGHLHDQGVSSKYNHGQGVFDTQMQNVACKLNSATNASEHGSIIDTCSSLSPSFSSNACDEIEHVSKVRQSLSHWTETLDMGSTQLTSGHCDKRGPHRVTGMRNTTELPKLRPSKSTPCASVANDISEQQLSYSKKKTRDPVSNGIQSESEHKRPFANRPVAIAQGAVESSVHLRCKVEEPSSNSKLYQQHSPGKEVQQAGFDHLRVLQADLDKLLLKLSAGPATRDYEVEGI